MARWVFIGACLLAARGAVTCAQVPVIDPAWVFITAPHWERVEGAPRSEGLRYSYGTLVVLYPTGLYAEVSAPIIKMSGKGRLGLDLNEGFLIRVGTWARTDDAMIRVRSREALRDKLVEKLQCDSNHANCRPAPDPSRDAEIVRNCRLEGRSKDHLAETIVCDGLVVSPPLSVIGLDDLPQIIQGIEAKTKAAGDHSISR